MTMEDWENIPDVDTSTRLGKRTDSPADHDEDQDMQDAQWQSVQPSAKQAKRDEQPQQLAKMRRD